MDVKIEKWEFDEKKSYKILKLTKCCDKIIMSDSVDLIYDYENDDDYDYSVKLIDRKVFHDYDDWDEVCIYEHIEFCPFCGEKINIEITNTVDKTEEYLSLKTQRDELWKKVIKTDSKKKELISRKQVYELDRKIDEFYANDSLEVIRWL